MEKIKVFSLGGLNENGKNLYVVDINDKLIIFDSGLKYATEKMYGVDYIIPDFKYLIENRKRIVGVFITHAHYENMGSLNELVNAIPEINVYATYYTSKVIEIESMEAGITIKNMHIIKSLIKIFNKFKYSYKFFLQISKIGHLLHLGFLAVQILLPW